MIGFLFVQMVLNAALVLANPDIEGIYTFHAQLVPFLGALPFLFRQKTRRHFCLPRLQWISALRLHQFEQRHLSRHSQKGNSSQGWRHFEHRHHDDSFRLPRRLFSHVLRRKRQSVGERTCRCRQTLSGRGNSGGGNAKSSFFGHRLRHSAYRRRAWI